MKKIVSLSLSIAVFMFCISVLSFAEGSIHPNGLPDVFPRTAVIGDSKAAPLACFNSFGSENGLEGLTCYLVGKVIRYEDMPTAGDKVFHGFVLQSEFGYALILDIYSYAVEYEATTPELKSAVEEPGSDYTFPEIGTFVKVLCVYSGYSTVYSMPQFYYGTPKVLMDQFSKESESKIQQSYTPTAGESNALKKAYQYLNVMAFSRTGLIAQLEYDGFTTAEATYAVDNCGTDWNEQAASKAGQYLSIMGFSKDGLIGQLEYDGFTHEQAVYGAEQNGY